MSTDNFDIILKTRLDRSEAAVNNLNKDIAFLDKKVGKGTNDGLNIKSTLDKSDETISRLIKDMSVIENKLKNTKINLSVQLDKTSLDTLQSQLKKLKLDIPVSPRMNGEVHKNTNKGNSANDIKMPSMDDFSNLNMKDAIRTQFQFDFNTGEMKRQIDTMNVSLLQTEKIIKTINSLGEVSMTREVDINKLKAQNEIYARIITLQKEMGIIDKQITVESNDKAVSNLKSMQDSRKSELELEKQKLIDLGLVNRAREEELIKLKDTQTILTQIASIKDKDSKSNQVYRELTTAIKEEFAVKKQMLGLEGEQASALQRRLMMTLQLQDGLKKELHGNGLHNKEKENVLLRERDKLMMDLITKEEKLDRKESIRVQRLGEKMQTPDLGNVNFDNKDGMKKYVQDMYGANAEITNFEQKIDSAGKRMYQMSVVTDTSANKLRVHKLAIDENTGSMYKMSESIKPNINRMLSLVDKMGEAIKSSAIWAVSMGLLYGNLRKLKDGINTVVELDGVLTQVAIGTGQTREQVKGLAEDYATLGIQMGKTVQEISNVSVELVRQGLSIEESKDRMQTILKLSAVGNLETEQTMKIVTSSVNALGVSAERAGDVLINAGQMTASSVEEIGDALTRVASSAQATGVSIEEVSSILSVLTEVTQESPQSLGNSLKTLLARFNKIDEVTGEVSEDFNKVQTAFQSVGVAFLDSEGQIRPFYELIKELSGVWETLDKNTKSYIATSAAGKVSAPLYSDI